MKSGDMLARMIARHAELASFRHPVVVGFSGGPDSVAVAHLLWRARQQTATVVPQPLILAHFNHGLRGADSEADEQFARQWAIQFQCPLRVGSASSRALASNESMPSGGSSEDALRSVRYDFMQQVAREFGARYLTTGHHQDDQTETILFRLFRGTSLTGLAGIPAQRRLEPELTLIRPLLNCSRQEILSYLSSQELPFRIDHSNEQTHYARNWLRQVLLPMLEQQWGNDVRLRVVNLSQQAAEHSELLDQLTDALLAKAVRDSSSDIQIDLAQLSQQPLPLVRHLLTRIWHMNQWPIGAMTFAHWNDLANQLHPATGLGIGQYWQGPGKVELLRISESTSVLRMSVPPNS